MTKQISMYNGLKISQALFELMYKIQRFSPLFAQKMETFDAEKRSSYEVHNSVTTYSGVFIARQQESPEKDVTDDGSGSETFWIFYFV